MLWPRRKDRMGQVVAVGSRASSVVIDSGQVRKSRWRRTGIYTQNLVILVFFFCLGLWGMSSGGGIFFNSEQASRAVKPRRTCLTDHSTSCRLLYQHEQSPLKLGNAS